MASQERINEIVKKMYEDIIQMYKDVEFETRDLHDCLIKLIECVELVPDLIGADKKKIVIAVITLAIEHLHIKETDKEKIIYMLTHDIISMIIDLIVYLSKHPCNINKKTVQLDAVLNQSHLCVII
jgi:hypothetical protein